MIGLYAPFVLKLHSLLEILINQADTELSIAYSSELRLCVMNVGLVFRGGA